MRIKLYLVASAAGVFLSSLSLHVPAAVAEDQKETQNITDIVITPNRYATARREVGSSVTVIDAEEIEKKKQENVLEALRGVPGVEVVQNGGAGRTSSVFIRGGESDHTLVLIDGVRVNDNTVGAFDFANLTVENIERIEVLKGAQSVLYGSEAIGGVINIITRKAASGLKATAQLSGGSHSTQSYSGSLLFANETFHSATTVGFFDTDGISAAATNRGNPEDDAHRNVTISTRSGVEFGGDGTADLTLRYTNAEADVDGFDFAVGAVDDPNFVQETDGLNGSLVIAKSVNEWLRPSVELGFQTEELEGTDPDTEFNNFEIENETQSALLSVDIDLPMNNLVTAGYSFESREGENKGNFDERRRVNSVFLQDQISWEESLFLTVGGRYDDDSDFGSETTYRLTLAYLLNDHGTRFHGSYGTGFKAPSFNELFFPNFGNPDLDAETSRGFDIGIEQAFLSNRALVDVTFFKNEFDDLIAFDTNTFLAANIQDAKAYGFETSLRLDITESIRTSASYTYTKSEDESTGRVLARRPRHKGSLDIFLNVAEKLDATASVLLVNSRRESTGEKMDNYERVDLSLIYSILPNVKPFVRIENLFDEDYEDLPGFGTLGLTAYAGVELSS